VTCSPELPLELYQWVPSIPSFKFSAKKPLHVVSAATLVANTWLLSHVPEVGGTEGEMVGGVDGATLGVVVVGDTVGDIIGVTDGGGSSA